MKSTDNILKGVIQYSRNKGISPQTSEYKSKERSRSKSSKRFIKSNQPSTKNLTVFTNSSIKNKVPQKHNLSKERLTSATSKKGYKE
jgi:hypothetical protein